VHAQSRDALFCNASVEFDLASLRPTYRLIWRSVGASNALAVAEGLGFDPLVIAEARKVRRCNLCCTFSVNVKEVGKLVMLQLSQSSSRTVCMWMGTNLFWQA
jgi:hypothetical protein